MALCCSLSGRESLPITWYVGRMRTPSISACAREVEECERTMISFSARMPVICGTCGVGGGGVGGTSPVIRTRASMLAARRERASLGGRVSRAAVEGSGVILGVVGRV